jgi:hypothetical protein
MLGALDASRISSFTLEIKIAGATAPTLDAWAELDPQAGSADRGEFIVHKLLQYPVSAATSGLFNIDSLPKGDTGTLFKRIHIIGPGGANIVTDSTVKMNGLVIHETSDKLNRFRHQEYKRVPQTAMHTIDWVLDGNQSNMLDTRGNSVRNLQLLLNLSAAGQMCASGRKQSTPSATCKGAWIRIIHGRKRRADGWRGRLTAGRCGDGWGDMLKRTVGYAAKSAIDAEYNYPHQIAQRQLTAARPGRRNLHRAGDVTKPGGMAKVLPWVMIAGWRSTADLPAERLIYVGNGSRAGDWRGRARPCIRHRGQAVVGVEQVQQ